MGRAPWRAQDIPDALLGRPSRPSLPAAELREALPDDAEFEVDADEVYVMLQELSNGNIQPVVWPMRLHVHGNDCGRA